MIKFVSRICFVQVLLSFFAAGLYAGIQPKPFVIPELKTWKGGEGFFVPAGARVVCPSGEPELLRVARLFASDYKEMFGKTMNVATGKGRKGDFVFSLQKDKELGREGYSVRIADRVEVTAPQGIGVYWATRTLLQMAASGEEQALPKGAIRDFPDYALRGFMIDCGRKYIPLSFLRDYVKIMAYYKMNTLQIHLNDNGFRQYSENDWNKTYAAFRLESDTYPGLTARDGSYSKQEFIDLQKLAESCYVEIIPEIDVPAHSLAFTHYRPEIGSKEYGMDHLDLFNLETYTFLDALFKEYLGGEHPVFRGKRVHIGTDEYSNRKKEVVEKFRYFTDYYIRYVESFGKQACVWGALTHAAGNTPVKSENVIMSAWYNGYAQPKEMVKQGYRLISIPDGFLYIVPAAGYYYDYLDTKNLYGNWTPARIGEEEFGEKDPAILGGMFAVWNDKVGNGISAKDIHDRTFPALQTMAVKMWTGKMVSVPYERFDRERKKVAEAPGVNIAGRLSLHPGLVYEQAEVLPGSRMPYREIGYDYRVSFDVEGAEERKGTELFRSPDAVFYLSDPVRGMLGFARDGYLNTFAYSVRKGEKLRVTVTGNNRETCLYLNGKLVEKLDKRMLYYNEGKDKMAYVRTLVFPLEQAGDFKSRITGLKVYQE